MKLEHGSSFCSDAGAVWRQLFVLALMPWMRKNRVLNEARLSASMKALSKRRMEAEDADQGVMGRFGEDMNDAMENVKQKGAAAVSGAAVVGTAAAGGVCDLGTAAALGVEDVGTAAKHMRASASKAVPFVSTSDSGEEAVEKSYSREDDGTPSN